MVEVVDGDFSFGEYSQLLNDFLCDCKEKRDYIDILWLSAIQKVIPNPEQFGDPSYTLTIGKDHDLLKSHLGKTFGKLSNWKDACKGQFLSLRGLPLKKSQGPWGTITGRYPESTTVETTGHPGSIWHESLHIFGVSDGYDEETKETLPGCEDCWMQYKSTKGRGLCEKHFNELKRFFSEGGEEFWKW